MRQYKNQYGTIFAVRQKAGVPRLMCRVEEGRSWVISGVLAPRTGDAKTEQELQAVLDRTAEELGWTECKDTDAPTGAAAANTGGDAASAESAEETSITSGSAADANTSTPATSSQPAGTSTLAPGSPAATAPAAPSPSGAEAASLGAGFDYSGLDNQTVNDLHLAEREYASGKRMAEMGLRRMADAVAIAHEVLVANCDKHNNQHSDDAFRRWCSAICITKDTAYRLLQVSNLFDRSTPREQRLLEELSPSLLYAAAKPSAPAELVQAVKDGDITTHKQYQELLSRYNAERDAREQAEQERDEVATHIQAARDMQIDTARERDAALKEKAALARDCNRLGLEAEKARKDRDEAIKQRDGARAALAASKLRGDKLKAENDALKARPIEAKVVDEEEIDRRAHKLADELTAPLREELESARAAAADPDQAELDARNAYDSIILASRTISNAWQSVKQQLAKIPPNQRSGAIDAFNKVLASIRSEAISCL